VTNPPVPPAAAENQFGSTARRPDAVVALFFGHNIYLSPFDGLNKTKQATCSVLATHYAQGVDKSIGTVRPSKHPVTAKSLFWKPR
jgi:hypothetical protein